MRRSRAAIPRLDPPTPPLTQRLKNRFGRQLCKLANRSTQTTSQIQHQILGHNSLASQVDCQDKVCHVQIVANGPKICEHHIVAGTNLTKDRS